MGRPPKKRPKRLSGQGRIWQRGGSWWIQWREPVRGATEGEKPKKERRFRKYPTQEQAEDVLAQILRNVAAGRPGLEELRVPTEPIAKLAGKWLERRAKTHRSADDDRWRWGKHLKPVFGHLKPDEVDTAKLRAFIEEKLAAGLSSSTVRLLVALMSVMFADFVEQGHARSNPCEKLPRRTRNLIRPAHDPKDTPFIEKLDDVRRIFLALPEPVNVAYALGVFAMLRNGEALALRWEHVDLEARRLHIRESIDGPLKDKESRIVPIQDALFPLLRELKLKSGGKGLVVRPLRSDGEHLNGNTMRDHLADVLEQLGLQKREKSTPGGKPRLNWYRCTRHTGASHWVMAGGSIEKLRAIMGHSTVAMTERYAHLKPELFGAGERAMIAVSLAPGGDRVVAIGDTGNAVATLATDKAS
jgi:integrase